MTDSKKPKRLKRRPKGGAPGGERREPIARVPSFVDGVVASIRLSFLRTMRGRKLRVAIIATLIVVLFPAVVALLDHDADRADVVNKGFTWGFFRLLLFLNPMLLSAGAVADEVEERTLPFLTMRPTSRWALLTGRFIVASAAGIVVTAAGIFVLHAIGYITDPTLLVDQFGATARVAGAASLLVIAYSAICMMWGVLLPEAATIMSVLYLGVIELCLGVAGKLRLVSMSHFARELAGLERWGLGGEVVPTIPLWGCALVLVGVTGAFFALALGIFRISQTRFGQS